MGYLNNYKLHSKMNLTLYVHQLHNQHMPSVRIVLAWCASGACLVPVWLAHGARLACSRCASSSPAMHVWLASGARLASTWPSHLSF